MERASKSSGEDQNLDRLSALPDDVICHILSFLPTQRSVQTSVLAKRWRLLWAHVPVIDLQDRYSLTKSFSGIACTVLLRHKAQTLNTFRLTYWGCTDAYELETCIATVVDRNVQNLILGLSGVEVPPCLLTCKTLVDLTMLMAVSIPRSAPVSLPSLKKVYYCCNKHGVDLDRLLSGCPVLEDLTIRGYPRSSCNISSPTLKRLYMAYLIDQKQPEYLVSITAPALTYLNVSNWSYKHISVLPPASLVEAHILLKTSFDSDDLCPRRVLKYVDSFCNVKCLIISGRDAKFPDLGVAGPYVRFRNLTKLQLNSDLRLLTKFLQSADRLQVLVFYDEIHHNDCESWTEPLVQRCACLLHSLKTVTIYDFRCTEQGCNMVRFILRNAQVLKRMEICCRQPNSKENFDALQRISLVCRGSRECELIFR